MSHHFISVSRLPAGGEKLHLSKFAGLIRVLRLTAVGGLVLSALLFLAGGAIQIGSKHFVTGADIHYSLRDVYSYSWLVAFVFCFTLALGGLFWCLLHNATNSRWGVAIRRLAETVAIQLPVICLIGLPLALIPQIRETLWLWMHEHAEAAKAGASSVQEYLHDHNHLLHVKYGYLNLWGSWVGGWLPFPGWVIRYFLYFIFLGFGALTLYRYSVSQDLTGDVRPTLSARRFSCGWLAIFALALTMASYDWVKGLNYAWFSTMFGVNFFAGAALSSMALLIVITVFFLERGYFKHIVTGEHLHLMGKLMLVFTIFWAYIAYGQYFLIWYANIAEETQFYGIRNTGGWNTYTILLLLIGHFLVPFLLLLPQIPKKNPRRIRNIALWVLFVHLCEIYWFIIPERGPKLADQPSILWAVILDAVALATVGSVVALSFLRALSQHSIYPCGDPRLQESINVMN
jgi:hypothetical protein